ncbi:hypothetical protein CcaverHIS002_0701930 [Cutaneotrichosporon cavernicola]|nr:hypothetical protein CcaverHIS002_0701930 [Cutaneotrichosporon cavernicola]
MLERRRDHIFRYIPKTETEGESEFDVEAQAVEVARTWHMWANESVKTSALVPALLMQALATGLLDATTYTDFKTFASNQTGNAIILTVAAVGTVSQSTTLLVRTAVSFGSFLLGAFVFWTDRLHFSRNRRFYYVIMMIGGSFIGAVMHRYSASWIVAVIAVGIKLVALAMVALAKPDGCYGN